MNDKNSKFATLKREVFDFMDEALSGLFVTAFFGIVEVMLWYRFQGAEGVVAKTSLGFLGVLFAMVFLAAFGTVCMLAWVWLAHSFKRKRTSR